MFGNLVVTLDVAISEVNLSRRGGAGQGLTSQSPPPVLLLHLPALLSLNPGWLAGKAPPFKSLAAHFLAPQELSCMWNALNLHAIYLTWLLQGTSSLA